MFFDRFRELCKKKGVLLSHAAREIGLNQSTVSMWRIQGTTPSAKNMEKIANYFGVSIGYLLGAEDSTPLNYNQNQLYEADDDFYSAFLNVVKDLNEKDRELILEMARILKAQEDSD